MTRKILIALVFMALLFCPAVVSAGSSDICFSLGDSEEGRYVFLFQKDGFNQYLDRTSMEDREITSWQRLWQYLKRPATTPGTRKGMLVYSDSERAEKKELFSA